MAKKENLKTFVIQQSDIDKAINYHLDKGGKDHRHLADCLEREMFYSYCWELFIVLFVRGMVFGRY